MYMYINERYREGGREGGRKERGRERGKREKEIYFKEQAYVIHFWGWQV